MTAEVRIAADEAKRLKHDTAFKQFIQDVRDGQILAFTNSLATDVGAREDAHAIIRALNQIEIMLEAAISAEIILDRRR